MKNRKLTKCFMCAFGLVASQSAQAAVTPDNVWEALTTQIAPFILEPDSGGLNQREGVFDFTKEDLDDGGIAIRDLDIRFGRIHSKITAQVDEITLTQQDDGTVLVTFPHHIPLTLRESLPTTQTVTMSGGVTQDNLALIVSGEPGAMSFAVTSDSLHVIVGTNGGPANARLTLHDLAIAAQFPELLDPDIAVTAPPLREYSYDIDIGAVNADYDMRGEVGSQSGRLDMERLQTDGTIIIPDILASFDVRNTPDVIRTVGLFDDDDIYARYKRSLALPRELFEHGLYFYADIRTGRMNFVNEIDDDGHATSSYRSNGSMFSVEANRDRLVLDASVHAADQSRLPSLSYGDPHRFAEQWHFDEAGFGLDIPFGRTEEPQYFSVSFGISNLVLDQNAWGASDPKGVFPQENMSVRAGFYGTADLNFDLFQPSQLDRMLGGERAFELHSIETIPLDDVGEHTRIKAPGAELGTTFKLTFNHSDYETFNGFPRPEGQVMLTMVGLDSLARNLIAVGLMDERDIQSLRDMLGSFIPVFSDESAQRTIMIDANGQIDVQASPN